MIDKDIIYDESFFICKSEFNIPSTNIEGVRDQDHLRLNKKDIFWFDSGHLSIRNLDGDFKSFKIINTRLIDFMIHNSNLNKKNETPIFIEVSAQMIRESKINKLLEIDNSDILNK